MIVRRSRVFVLAGLSTACIAAAAWAHDDNVIDLEALETYVAQKDAATATATDKPGRAIHKAWKALDKALEKHSKDRLANDIGKLAAASIAANGKLVADGTLYSLLVNALDLVDQKLSTTPDDLSSLIGNLRLQADRNKVLALVIGVHGGKHVTLGGRDFYDKGKIARDTGDQTGQIKAWKQAATKFASAVSTANSIINKKQHGVPLPQTKVAAASRVYTVVGSGQPGFNGDGHSARTSQLYSVEECRVGPDGLLYILDWNNHRLRRRETDGTLTRICGSGIPGDSEGAPMTTDLNHPSSLVFEPTQNGTLGKIYLAAWHNHKVKVYDPKGGVDPRFNKDAEGNPRPWVYTIAGTTQGGGIVNAVDTSGDGGNATSAKYNLLPGIVRLTVDTAIGKAGDLLTADAANETVRRIELSNKFVAGNLIGTQVETGKISRVAGTLGQTGIAGDGGDALSCTLNFSKAQNAEPDGRMELTADGKKIYIICGQGHCIRVMDLMTGVIDRFAGTGNVTDATHPLGDGGPATLATLNRPADIAVVAAGNAAFPEGTVFISDSYNNIIRKVAPDGTISTYAGASTGAAGLALDPTSDGDDIPVADAEFSHPAGLEIDANGNLYVCDRQNHVVRVITSPVPGTTIPLPIKPFAIPGNTKGGPPTRGASGTIATYAGHAPDAEGDATAIAPHRSFNGDGHGALDTDLYWPQDVTVDTVNPLATARVYFVDWNNHRIRRINDTSGTVETVIGSGLLGDTGGEGPDAKLNHPTDIAIHPLTGDLWVAAWHTDKILRLDTSGGSGHLFYMAGRSRSFSGDGSPASVPATGFDPIPVPGGPTVATPIGMAQMNIPVSVKFATNGDWYVSDEGNQRVRVVDHATDVINTILGNGTQSPDSLPATIGDNGPAANATVNLPVGQAAQPAGRICLSPDNHWLYVCDTNNERVRRIDLLDANRQITTIAGNGIAGCSGDGAAATSAQLNFPCDVDCDKDGNIYIADRDNNVIRKVNFVTNVITTVAGNATAGAGFSGDSGPATAARLQQPCGVFVVRTGSQAGRLYIADTYNSVIRVVWE